MFWAVKQSGEARRLGKHLPKPVKLFVAVQKSSGMIA